MVDQRDKLEEKKMEPDQVVWPWSLEKFKGHWRRKQFITGKLRSKYYYLYKELEGRTNYPSPKMIKAIQLMVCTIAEFKDNGELPWTLLTGNDPAVLKEISEILPIAWALTRVTSCNVVSTEYAMKLLKPYQDEIDREIAENIWEEMKSCGFLSWHNVTAPVSGSQKQAGRFLGLLVERAARNLPTLFTATIATKGESVIRTVSEKVSPILGTDVAALLNRIPHVFAYKTEKVSKSLTFFE
jgi:hypothetical protein